MFIVDNLEQGVAATTTLAVQERAGVSRGALLHHFPIREDLFGAAVGRLVGANERAVREELAAAGDGGDRLARALRVLWAVARTDPRLGDVLRRAEGAARRELYRVIDDVLSAPATTCTGWAPNGPSGCC